MNRIPARATSRNRVSCFQLESGAKLMKVRVDDPKIRRHPNAQRTKRNNKHVNSIIVDYNPMLDLPIIISYNNGWKDVVDGDHRFTARKKMYERGEGSVYVDAIVYFDLSTKQQHALFYGANQKKKQLDSQSKWYNGYHGGEKHIVGAINLIAKLGYSCSIGPKDDTAMVTNHTEYDWRGNKCIGTLVALYEKCPTITEQWLHGLQGWRIRNGNLHPDTMSVELLKGSYYFVKRFCSDFTNEKIRKVFSRTDPSKVRSTATRLQLKNGKCRADALYVEAMARATNSFKGGKVVVKV